MVISYYYKCSELLDESCEENERQTVAKENKNHTRFQSVNTGYGTNIHEVCGLN